MGAEGTSSEGRRTLLDRTLARLLRPRGREVHGLARSVVHVIRGARDDRVTGLAAEVAYFGLLSLIPGSVALAAAVTLMGNVRGGEAGRAAETAILRWAERLLTDEASAVTSAIRDLFDRSNSDVFTVAVIVAIWSGSRGMDSIVRSVVLVGNHVERRPWWRRRLLSVGLLLGTALAGALLVMVLVVGPLLGGGQAVADAIGVGPSFATAWRWARLPVAGGALFTWALVVLHTARPGVDRWRLDVPGALTATVLWIVASLGLSAYVGTLGASNPALGALGGVAIVLVWFYVLALSLLIGAEVAQRSRERPRLTSSDLEGI